MVLSSQLLTYNFLLFFRIAEKGINLDVSGVHYPLPHPPSQYLPIELWIRNGYLIVMIIY